MTFCPLTGSAVAWTRIVNSEVTTFGVSGLIHKNNLIAYDRATETNWSQMLELGVNGGMAGERPESHQIIEMNWKTWKTIFPGSKVLSGRTGFDRNYSLYPYGRNYAGDNNNILFPIHLEDDRLERKTLAHGVFYDTNLHVFPVELFPDTILVLNRSIAGNDIVVAGSSGNELVISYSRKADDDTVLRFKPSEKNYQYLWRMKKGTSGMYSANVWRAPEAEKN